MLKLIVTALQQENMLLIKKCEWLKNEKCKKWYLVKVELKMLNSKHQEDD